MNGLIDSNKVMQSRWQTGVAIAKLDFHEEARFQIFTQK